MQYVYCAYTKYLTQQIKEKQTTQTYFNEPEMHFTKNKVHQDLCAHEKVFKINIPKDIKTIKKY